MSKESTKSSSTLVVKEPDIIIAASERDIEKIKELIIKGADVNQRKTNGATALILAAQADNIEMVEFLLKAGAALELVANSGYTALCKACSRGYAQIAKALINAGADVDFAIGNNATPLYIAAANGHLNIVKILLEARADKDKSLNEGYSPLWIAVYKGHKEIVRSLLKAGANYNSFGQSIAPILFVAVKHGNLEIVNMLIGAGVDVKEKFSDFTALYIATRFGYAKIVKALLDAGADYNQRFPRKGFALILTAIDYNQLDVVKVFINYKLVNIKKLFSYYPELSFKVCTYLYYAVFKGQTEIVNFLLGEGADCNISRNGYFSPLIEASNLGHLDIVYSLIKAGADINKEVYNSTSLSVAVEAGHVEVVKTLIEEGANFDKSMADKYLKIASEKGHYKLCKFLLNKTSYDEQDIINSYVCAIEKGHYDIVLILLGEIKNKKFILSKVDENNNTSLILACEYNHIKIVEMLLSRGVSINDQNSTGITALWYACKNKNLEIVQMLLLRGANVNIKSQCWDSNEFICDIFFEQRLQKYIFKRNNTRSGQEVSPLWLACYNGSVEIARALLNAGARYIQNACLKRERRKDIVNISPLYIASEKGHLEIVKLLLEYYSVKEVNFVDSVSYPTTALWAACYHNHNSIINLLLNSGAVIQQNMLEAVVLNGNIHLVRKFLEAGLTVTNKHLFLAIKFVHYEIVKEFLTRGVIDLSPVLRQRDYNYLSIEHFFSFRGPDNLMLKADDVYIFWQDNRDLKKIDQNLIRIFKLFRRLRNDEFDINDTYDSSSALHHAIKNPDIFNVLLNYNKININIQNKDSKTPLHLIVDKISSHNFCEFENILRMLVLDQRTDFFIKDNSDSTVLKAFSIVKSKSGWIVSDKSFIVQDKSMTHSYKKNFIQYQNLIQVCIEGKKRWSENRSAWIGAVMMSANRSSRNKESSDGIGDFVPNIIAAATSLPILSANMSSKKVVKGCCSIS